MKWWDVFRADGTPGATAAHFDPVACASRLLIIRNGSFDDVRRFRN